MTAALAWRARWELLCRSRWQDSPRGGLVPIPREPVYSPRPLPESNESVKAIRAIEEQLKEFIPVKETP